MRKLAPALVVAALLAGCGSLLGVGDDPTPDRVDPADGAAPSSNADASTDASTAVDADSSTASDAADSGATGGKLVFVTMGAFAPNEGGRAYYDQECQVEANGAGLTGTFVAWMSTTGSSALSRLPQNVSWYLPTTRGAADPTKPVITSTAYIAGGGFPINGINRTAAGNPAVGEMRVWTGTGNLGAVDGTCGDWMVEVGVGTRGNVGATTALWTASTADTCAQSNLGRVYCFQQ